jgi:hypothetical protein
LLLRSQRKSRRSTGRLKIDRRPGFRRGDEPVQGRNGLAPEFGN